MTTPAECPVCGAYSLSPDSRVSALLAVCDVLCLKALEAMGKWIVRIDRARFNLMEGRHWYEAHTLWQVDDEIVDKALRGAWDVVPAMMDNHGFEGVTSGEVTEMLDSYVHDLVITGTPHSVEELAYRFQSRLHLPVYCEEPS